MASFSMQLHGVAYENISARSTSLTRAIQEKTDGTRAQHDLWGQRGQWRGQHDQWSQHAQWRGQHGQRPDQRGPVSTLPTRPDMVRALPPDRIWHQCRTVVPFAACTIISRHEPPPFPYRACRSAAYAAPRHAKTGLAKSIQVGYNGVARDLFHDSRAAGATTPGTA